MIRLQRKHLPLVAVLTLCLGLALARNGRDWAPLTAAAELGDKDFVPAPNEIEDVRDNAQPDGRGTSQFRRYREGTVVEDYYGQFKTSGKRWVFVVDQDTERYVALENLNLERVARILAERPDSPTWRITGQITEFSGANYLLIQHVVLVSDPTRIKSRKP